MGYSAGACLRAVLTHSGGEEDAGLTEKETIWKAGAAMFFRFTSVGCGANPNLLEHLLHRITTLILISFTGFLSICLVIPGICGEKRSVPNIVLILAHDLGYGFATKILDWDGDGVKEAVIYDRRYVWVYRADPSVR